MVERVTVVGKPLNECDDEQQETLSDQMARGAGVDEVYMATSSWLRRS
jgi:hypothetical protein